MAISILSGVSWQLHQAFPDLKIYQNPPKQNTSNADYALLLVSADFARKLDSPTAGQKILMVATVTIVITCPDPGNNQPRLQDYAFGLAEEFGRSAIIEYETGMAAQVTRLSYDIKDNTLAFSLGITKMLNIPAATPPDVFMQELTTNEFVEETD